METSSSVPVSPTGVVNRWIRRRPVVTVLPLNGVIRAASGPGRGGISLAALENVIAAAFKPKPLAAVALAVNSPGGSPVQSKLVYAAIRRAAKKSNAPVLAFVEDVAASGGYLLALAADEIYADGASVIGSIGVISAGFGFHEAIARLGVERRVHTSGTAKSQLDPFKKEEAEDVRRLEAILDDIHRQFIALVKERRGDRLSTAADLFTGAFWSAGPALDRGLIDGVDCLGDHLRKRFGERVKIRKIDIKSSLLKKLTAGVHGTNSGDKIDAGMFSVDEAIAEIEARALWSRYGL